MNKSYEDWRCEICGCTTLCGVRFCYDCSEIEIETLRARIAELEKQLKYKGKLVSADEYRLKQLEKENAELRETVNILRGDKPTCPADIDVGYGAGMPAPDEETPNEP